MIAMFTNINVSVLILLYFILYLHFIRILIFSVFRTGKLKQLQYKVSENMSYVSVYDVGSFAQVKAMLKYKYLLEFQNPLTMKQSFEYRIITTIHEMLYMYLAQTYNLRYQYNFMTS